MTKILSDSCNVTGRRAAWGAFRSTIADPVEPGVSLDLRVQRLAHAALRKKPSPAPIGQLESILSFALIASYLAYASGQIFNIFTATL